jgi:hypothetical protein
MSWAGSGKLTWSWPYFGLLWFEQVWLTASSWEI